MRTTLDGITVTRGHARLALRKIKADAELALARVERDRFVLQKFLREVRVALSQVELTKDKKVTFVKRRAHGNKD